MRPILMALTALCIWDYECVEYKGHGGGFGTSRYTDGSISDIRPSTIIGTPNIVFAHIVNLWAIGLFGCQLFMGEKLQ